MKTIKTLYAHLGKYKPYLFLTYMFVIIESIIDLLIPLYMADIINATKDSNIKQVLITGSILFLMSILALFFSILSGILSAKFSCGFSYNLRDAMYDRIQSFSFTEIDAFSTPSLITRITTDVSFVQQTLQVSVRSFIRAPIMITVAMILSLRINWKYSLIFLIEVIFFFICTAIILPIMHPRFLRLFKELDKLNLVTEENLSGIRLVKSYGREKHEIDKFNIVSDKLRKLSIRAEKIGAIVMPLMGFFVYLTIIISLYLGSQDILARNMDIGELSSLLAYAIQIFMSLTLFSVGLIVLIISRVSAVRISEVLNSKSSIVNKENPVMEVKDGSIEFNNVTFAYAKEVDQYILDKMSFSIKSGETIGILGATGSAKSTIVQLIPRLYDVLDGSVKIAGVDVRDYDIKTLRDQVAIVLQKNTIFEGTIRENMQWGNLAATDEEIWKALDLAAASDFVKQKSAGLDERVLKNGSNFSGGQKQRLCIARALLKTPKIIIFDDSTSAVDTKTDFMIQKKLKEFRPDLTKIIITQRINSIQEADKIFVIERGQIVGEGKHNELVQNNEIYREIYETQASMNGGLDFAKRKK